MTTTSSSMDTFLVGERAAGYPNPAFDYLSGFVPRRLKDIFKWCEYLAYNSAHIYAALRKFAELVITNIEYDTADERLRTIYKDQFEDGLKIRSAALTASYDKYVYGNFFTSMYQPFVRYLRCGSCDQLSNINKVADYHFDLKSMRFRYKCRHCRLATTGTLVDKKVRDPHRMNPIRWDVKQIDIDYNPMTGQSEYYYAIPEDVSDRVRQGSKHLINSMPVEFLRTIKDKRLFKFKSDSLMHVKITGPSGIQQQWGLPPLVSTMKLFLYTLTLRKANEAIALEHIVPFRVMFPQAANGTDPAMQISMARFTDELRNGIKQHRRDPNHILFSPVAVGTSTLGGDGRALLTLGEVQEADKSLMAALGFPQEFLYGGLTKAGMDGTIRMLENQLQNHADDMTNVVQFYADRFADHMGVARVKVKLTPMKMVDDTETKQMMMQLATGQLGTTLVSLSTLAERMGVDVAAEREKRLQDAIDEATFQNKVNAKIQAMQQTLASQVQAQTTGAQGLNYDQQAVIARADELVQQLSTITDQERRSMLHGLQVEDAVMYAVVIQRWEEYQRMQTQQVKQQMTGAPQPGGM